MEETGWIVAAAGKLGMREYVVGTQVTEDPDFMGYFGGRWR